MSPRKIVVPLRAGKSRRPYGSGWPWATGVLRAGTLLVCSSLLSWLSPVARVRAQAVVDLALGADAGLPTTDGGSDEAAAVPPPPPADFAALTVSGGVSLGSHEAGLLFALTERMKATPDAPPVRVAAGASAGSVNALFALLNACREADPEPYHDMGYRTWIPVGVHDLFAAKEVHAQAVLSREPLERAMERVGDSLRAGLPRECDVLLGVTTTRKHPDQTRLSLRADEALSAPRLVEHFAIRIRGRGQGRMPLIENFIDIQSPLPALMLALEHGGDDAQIRNFRRLSELIFASAAFPIAFAPYRLEHCPGPDPRTAEMRGFDAPTCKPSQVRVAEFIDGGVFDNTPLRLTMRLARNGLFVSGSGKSQIAVGRHLQVRDNRVRYLYVNPGVGEYPPLDPPSAQPLAPGVVSLAADFATAFVDTARRRELFAVLEDGAGQEALADLVVNRIDYPTISNKMLAFFGFFERDFRVFDYYLGMVEGLSLLAAEKTSQERGKGQPWLLPETPAEVSGGLRPLACLLSYLEPPLSRYRSSCEGEDLLNFRILLQVTLDRVRAACSVLPEHDADSSTARYCQERETSMRTPLVDGLMIVPEATRQRSPAETDLEYLLRMLAAYRFEFSDLGLTRAEAEYGVVYVRRTLLKMIQRLADKQPSALEEVGLLTMGRAAINELHYEPPDGWLYLTAGTTLELGGSVQPFAWHESWVRFNLALQLKNWQSLIAAHRVTTALTPAIGPEFGLLFLSNSVVQTLVGARVGLQLGFADRFLFRTCRQQGAWGDGRNCSQVVMQHYWAVTLVERLRAQMVLEWFPFAPDGVAMDSRFALHLGFGLQIF